MHMHMCQAYMFCYALGMCLLHCSLLLSSYSGVFFQVESCWCCSRQRVWHQSLLYCGQGPQCRRHHDISEYHCHLATVTSSIPQTTAVTRVWCHHLCQAHDQHGSAGPLTGHAGSGQRQLAVVFALMCLPFMKSGHKLFQASTDTTSQEVLNISLRVLVLCCNQVNGAFGSGVISPSTGILFGNTMDDFAQPNK